MTALQPDREGSIIIVRSLQVRDQAVCPERIVTLGQVPLRAVSEIFGLPLPRRLSELRDVMQWVRISGASIPVGATYFAGNNRHRGFADIVRTIEQVLSTHTERKKA